MEYEIKPKNKLTLGIDELIQYRELFYFFTWRDIKVKYKQTFLGFAWAIIQPLAMTLLLSVTLGKIISTAGMLPIPYPLFALSGLLIWNIFSSGLSNAGNSMVSNANIIKKIYFPRLIIPVSAVLVSLFDFIMAFVIFIGMLFYYHNEVSINILQFLLLLPLSVLLTCISTFGLGSLLAALNIKYRDFRYVIPFFVQALLFVTPVIYPISLISNSSIKFIFAINPMYAPIELFRHSIIQQHLNFHLLIISLFSSILFFVIGLFYFRKTEFYFADLA